ncbi:hypothetical protein RRG08_044141 [Elysia crispata]|uniref:Uncharacterized protein n=1 Tax=Elysia crispata TaxID=231223 RepID=A0AAE0Z7R7_9GAST|nr:hypothetical protein RRG08_044141 [Elysia crispata]
MVPYCYYCCEKSSSLAFIERHVTDTLMPAIDDRQKREFPPFLPGMHCGIRHVLIYPTATSFPARSPKCSRCDIEIERLARAIFS